MAKVSTITFLLRRSRLARPHPRHQNPGLWLHDELHLLVRVLAQAALHLRLLPMKAHSAAPHLPSAGYLIWCVMVQWVLPIHQAVGHLEIFWSRVPIFFIGINMGQLVKEKRQIDGSGVWMLLLIWLLTFATCIYLEQVRHGHFPLFVERMLYIPFTLTSIYCFNRIFPRT